MDLSKQSITGHQFDLNRRGYDPDAVDAHLASIASAVAEREARIAQLESAVADLKSKVRDADESEEALRLTLKAAAHAKEELLAGAREQAEKLETEAEAKAEQILAAATERANQLDTDAEARAKALGESARVRARDVAGAALTESELLVSRIEDLRGRVASAEQSLNSLSAEATPALGEAKAALDEALAKARETAENPEVIEQLAAQETAGAAASGGPTVAIPEAGAGATDGGESLGAVQSVPDGAEASDSDAAEELSSGHPTAEETAAPPTGVPAGEPKAEGDAAPDDTAGSGSDISDKVDRLLEELREVT